MSLYHYPYTVPAPCPVCGLEDQRVALKHNNIDQFECARCGEFGVSNGAGFALRELADADRPKISGWIFEQNSQRTIPTIRETDVPGLTSRAPLAFIDRVRRLLLYFASDTMMPGDIVDYEPRKIEAVVQFFGPGPRAHTQAVLQYLEKRAWIEPHSFGGYTLTPEGLIQAEEWGRSFSVSSQGFVAMWFDATMAPAWQEGIEPAIAAAGYQPKRIDQGEHVNKICDEIVAEIRKSRFVVADFTGHRGGVYFEAGFAFGRELPVIWTCRKDYLDKLHFDIRQYNCIDWSTPAELRARLQKRIEAVLGIGPVKR